MSTATKMPETHEMGQAFDLNGQFTVPCSCGRRYTSSTPSAAISRWRKSPTCGPKEEKTAQPVAERIRTCGCGCGGQLAAKAGGLFLSGHDARFKSILTRAHTEHARVRHPQTGQDADPLEIADWLDQRRGGGSFWRDKVLKGLKDSAPRQPRQSRAADTGPVRGAARAEALIQALAARRPAAGQEGMYVSRDGKTRSGAKVVRRNDETTLVLRVLDGRLRNQEIIVPDNRFEKK